MKIRKLALVKYDYDSHPEDWKKIHTNPYLNNVFCYFGNVPNMTLGHSYVQDIHTGMCYIFHTEDLKELTDDET